MSLRLLYILKTQNINIDVKFKLSGTVSTVIVSDSKIPLEKIELEGENHISEIRIVGKNWCFRFKSGKENGFVVC